MEVEVDVPNQVDRLGHAMTRVLGSGRRRSRWWKERRDHTIKRDNDPHQESSQSQSKWEN
jgi:hypothetical protein